MTRLLRRPLAGVAGYIPLGLFLAVYLSALGLVLVPGIADGPDRPGTPADR